MSKIFRRRKRLPDDEVARYLISQMCEHIGVPYDYEAIKSNKEWYLGHTWTKEQELDFVEKAESWMRNVQGVTKREAGIGLAYFLLMYGWKRGDNAAPQEVKAG